MFSKPLCHNYLDSGWLGKGSSSRLSHFLGSSRCWTLKQLHRRKLRPPFPSHPGAARGSLAVLPTRCPVSCSDSFQMMTSLVTRGKHFVRLFCGLHSFRKFNYCLFSANLTQWVYAFGVRLLNRASIVQRQERCGNSWVLGDF